MNFEFLEIEQQEKETVMISKAELTKLHSNTDHLEELQDAGADKWYGRNIL